MDEANLAKSSNTAVVDAQAELTAATSAIETEWSGYADAQASISNAQAAVNTAQAVLNQASDEWTPLNNALISTGSAFTAQAINQVNYNPFLFIQKDYDSKRDEYLITITNETNNMLANYNYDWSYPDVSIENILKTFTTSAQTASNVSSLKISLQEKVNQIDEI